MQTAAQAATVTSISNDAPVRDIVDTAIAAGSFTLFVNAIKAAGLVATFKGPGPFTVFAPTDAAFRNLPAGTLDRLLKDKEKLATILTYHVVAGKVMARDVKEGDLASVQGGLLKVFLPGNAVRINNAKVIKTDIEASNGVIHSIDTVLMPS